MATKLHDYITRRVEAATMQHLTPITLESAVSRATAQTKNSLINAIRDRDAPQAGRLIISILDDFLAARIAAKVTALEQQAGITDTDLDSGA